MNQMIFDCNKERKLANKFLATLLNHNRDCLDNYNDIHIYQEEDLIIIEWTQKGYDEPEDNGVFRFVDYNQEIMTEVYFPDNSSMYVQPSEEGNALDEWLKEHPTYEKDQFGVYRDTSKYN